MGGNQTSLTICLRRAGAMREYSEMIEEYLNQIDGLEDVSPAAAPVRPEELAIELEHGVAAVLRAAAPGRVKRPCRRRRTAWTPTARRKLAARG
jgi:hypothetical protein